MGCRCCRMIKSYIYDPSVTVDGRKTDSAVTSLYQPHHLPERPPSRDQLGGHDKQKQGIHNLAYSKSNDSTLKLEVDNNHVNQRLHAAPVPAKELHQQASGFPADGDLYIIQPDAPGPRWMTHKKTPSQVPVYPDITEYDNQRGYGESREQWDTSISKCRNGSESLSADEIDVDEGVGGTPDYPCDTGDEGSALSVDIQTSTTSLSSVDTRDELRLRKAPDASTMESGICVTKSEEEGQQARNDEEEARSITDSMVAEALDALEAATAGEDFD